MEHRCGGRKAVNFPVRVISRPGLLGSGVIRNLSRSGAYLHTDLLLAAPSWVRLEPLYVASPESDVAGGESCVVRSTRDGVGIEWNDAAPPWATPLLCGEWPTAEPAEAEAASDCSFQSAACV
jgi:hypothetical protein